MLDNRLGWLVGVAGVVAGCAADRPAPCSGKLEVHDRADVAAVGACPSIDGDLWITDSTLADLRGLENVRSVRYLVIANNANLTTLDGLEGIESADGVSLWSNPVLASVEALSHADRLGALVALDQEPSGLDRVVARTVGAAVTRATCGGDER